MIAALLLTLAGAVPLASTHIAFWHPSMYGFNVTDTTYPYDNRPVAPLLDMTFDQWWFHGHLDHPPNPGDFFELHPGQPATTELACHKAQTSYFASSESPVDLRDGNNPCTGSSFPDGAMHTLGFDDLTGCALAIAYESDVTKIKPEDFTVFSVNHTCVWTRETEFQVPERMPPCPEDGCHCAWFWIHSPKSGGEQNYMNGFKCKVMNSTSTVPLAKPQVPRRCGADPEFDKPEAAPGNCTFGAKQPFYWFQTERNNMFEDTYAPPFYTDLYNFRDGAQDDIFEDSYPKDLPPPSPNSTFVPTPFLGGDGVPAGESSSSPPPSSSAEPSSSYTDSPTVSSSVPVPPDSTFTISTLPQTGSGAPSSSIPPPRLPLSTESASMPLSQFTSVVESTSVTVSTSVVVSTLVVTVTSAPAPTSTDISGSASSSSVSEVTSSSVPSDSVNPNDNAAGASASPTFMATEAPPTISDTPRSTGAPMTIILNSIPTSSPSPFDFAARKTDTDDAEKGTMTKLSQANEFTLLRPRPAVLITDTAATLGGRACKREVGQRKVFRRRVPISRASQVPQKADPEDTSILSWIPRMAKRGTLSDRSRLWSFI